MEASGSLLLTFALSHLLIVMSPGPSFLMVVRTSLSRSRAAAAWTAVGLGVGSLIWAAAALAGLKLVFAAVPWLYTALRVAGALYLLWIAWQLWRHAGDALNETGGPSGAPPEPWWRGVARGTTTQLSNPKAAVFFGSVFLQLLPPTAGPAMLGAVFAIIAVNEVGWYLLVAGAFSVTRLRRAYLRAKRTLDRAAGLCLAGLGLKLALDR